MQLICLNEGLRTSHEDMTAVASLMHGDIRRCLLCLQFWVHSGIRNRCPMPVTFNHKHLQMGETQAIEKKEADPPPKNSVDSDDDFQVAQTRKKRKCRTLIDDEESGPEIPPAVLNDDSQSSLTPFLPFSPDVRNMDTLALKEAEYVDKFFLESLCNVAELTGQNTAIQVWCQNPYFKIKLLFHSVSAQKQKMPLQPSVFVVCFPNPHKMSFTAICHLFCT
jgi:hypothetical protein